MKVTMKKMKCLSLACSFLFLAGCSMKPAGEPPLGFGNSVRQNIAAQTVNPDAPNTDDAPYHEGTRTSIAQHRYITDKVEKPGTTTTSSLQGSGGGK